MTAVDRSTAQQRRQVARDARVLFRETIVQAKDAGHVLAYIADAVLGALDNADALDAEVVALFEAENQRFATAIRSATNRIACTCQSMAVAPTRACIYHLLAGALAAVEEDR